MTISTTSSAVTAAGNGATTSFNFPFVYGTASNILGTLQVSAPTGARVQSGSCTVMLR